MNSVKVDTIINWPTLVNVKDVQSFLEFTNFYRRFIYDYSKIAALLTHHTHKDVAFEWFSECENAFNTLKRAFTSDVILCHYNSDLKLVMKTDASDYVSGGILSQYDENDVLHPVVYFFKKHSPAKCNYEIYNKELMAIICAFEEWCPELEGSSTPVEVITDHKNLEYFMSTKQLSCRQARWSEFLSHFNYCITYCPGKARGKPDALTCWSGNLSKERDTQDPRHLHQHQTVLKSHILDLRIQEDLQNVFKLRILNLQCRTVALDLIQLHLSPVQLSSLINLASMKLDTEDSEPETNDPEPQLDQEILNSNEDPADIPTQTLWDQATSCDEFASQVLKALRNGVQYNSRIPLAEYENQVNSLYFYGRKYVSNSNYLCLQIIQLAHDSVADEHSERAKCSDLVSHAYWWLNIYKYVQHFIWNCHVCTWFKPSHQKTQEWLRSLLVPQRRWHDVSMNYVGSLLPSTFMSITYWYILVFVNCLIKMRHLVSTATMKVKEVTNAYYAHVWKHHSLPEFFLSDWGTQFTSDVWSHLCQMLKIDAKLFTAYHPETDDQTERMNAVMKHYLQAFCNYMQNDWAKWVSGAEFSANNAPSAITLASPFLVNSG